MNITKRKFTNTHAALIEYDASALARNEAWNDASCKESIDAAEKADKDALASVQASFHLDTHDINSRENCALIDLDFVRRMAKDD
jgi:hypothetical protein